MLDDGGGRIGTIALDDNRDGKPDRALYDTDHNGKIDMVGVYRAGENEPYRFERVAG